jgi:hypothetical protein
VSPRFQIDLRRACHRRRLRRSHGLTAMVDPVPYTPLLVLELTLETVGAVVPTALRKARASLGEDGVFNSVSATVRGSFPLRIPCSRRVDRLETVLLTSGIPARQRSVRPNRGQSIPRRSANRCKTPPAYTVLPGETDRLETVPSAFGFQLANTFHPSQLRPIDSASFPPRIDRKTPPRTPCSRRSTGWRPCYRRSDPGLPSRSIRPNRRQAVPRRPADGRRRPPCVYTVLPEIDRALTELFEFGFPAQERSIRPNRRQPVPRRPADGRKRPPAYTVLREIARAMTGVSRIRTPSSTVFPSRSQIAANRFRVVPLMVVNAPPRTPCSRRSPGR